MQRRERRWRGHPAAVLAALLVVACDAGSNPFASFEDHCTELPPSRFVVSTVPVTYVQDESQSIDQLTVRGGSTPGLHMTFGLTTVVFGHQTQTEVRSVEDRAGARACGTLEVSVRLSMQPVTIYLAQELDGSPCARTATLEHELKHLAVFEDVLDETARELAASLAGAVGTGLQRAGSQADLQRQVNARVNDYISGFMQRRQKSLDERQAAVDSPVEHARVKAACPQ